MTKKYQEGGDVNPFAKYAAEREAQGNPYAQFAMPGTPEGPPVPEVSKFPMERGTSRASIQLPELAQIGTRSMFPEGTGIGTQMGLTAAMLTTTDPNEIAQIFTQEIEFEDPETGEMKSQRMFPNIGMQTAPDGALIIANNETGQRALINRPGISTMDILQTLGIGASFTPAGRGAALAGSAGRKAAQVAATQTAKQLALQQAKKRSAMALVAGSGATEAVLQGGQELAGGEFNTGDIAFSAATGMLPDYALDPLIRAGTKLPGTIGSALKEVIPENVQQALTYARQTGRKITTSDALQEFMTPAMNIFFKVAERIPITGTGGQRIRQQAQRADALTELADRFDINVNGEYGREVMENFVDRMIKRRFWGPNKNPTPEMVERAFAKEADELTRGILQRYIRVGNIDEEVADAVLKSGNTRQVGELFNKLMPEGKAALRQRFMARGLERAGWTPEASSIANPKKFLDYLDSPEARRTMGEIFDEVDQDLLKGAREYLRMTSAAANTGKGAGMTAAVAGGAGFALGMLDAVAGGAAIMGGAGRTAQSDIARNFLLRLAHAEGNEAATAAIMSEARPFFQAVGDQWQQESWDLPSMEVTEEMVEQGSSSAMDELRRRATEAGESILGLPARFMGGGEQPQQ